MPFMLRVPSIVLVVLTGFIFAFSSSQTYASHSMGIDFYYTCLGGNSYEFTMAFYRDCAGISPPSSVTINGSSSCGNNSFTLNPVGSCVELTNLCIGNPNSTCNGGSDPGSEQCIYTGTVNLANCADWEFSFTECCRNALITNLVAPDDENMYVEASLDNSSGACNSSPQFTELPVPFICDGQPFCYDHGAIDADGDSLVYTLINPMTNGGSSIGYTAGYSVNYPITTQSGSINFDAATGQMCFTPIGPQVCVITLLVEEYRAGVIIGSTMRDLQVIVLDCTNDPPPVQVNVPCGATYITLDILDPILCSSIASDGSDFTLTGPGSPFTVTGVTGINCGTNTTQIQIDISPSVTMGAAYTLTIVTGTDGNTLINDCGESMDDPTIIPFTASPAAAQIFGDNTICDGSSVVLTASAGSAWQWNTGATSQTITVTPSNTTTYSVTVFNDTCSQNASITVNVDPAPTAGFTAAPNPVCVGQPVSFSNTTTESGACFLISTNFYFWDFGDGGLAIPDISENPTHTYSSAGTYTVTLNVQEVGINCGCNDVYTLDVVVTTCTPCSYTVATTQVGTLCNGSCDGSALATPANGTAPYSYQWDTNAGSQTSANATGLCAGSYTVSVTDNAGCLETATIVVTEPGLLGLGTTFTPTACNGSSNGTASATPTGGATPYQYNWSNGQLTSTATGLVAGTYTITVTDNNTCTNTATVTVTEPSGMGPTVSTVGQNCGVADGSATVNLSGGTGPFTYIWSNGQTGSTDTALFAGVYTVTITDASGCSEALAAVVNGLGGPSLSTLSTNVSCNAADDGTGTANASGGVAPYTYVWNDLGTQTTSIATGLGSGTFNVSVSDTSGCIAIGTISILEPQALGLTMDSTNAGCGIPDGTASVAVLGGTGSYTYLWSPSGGTTSMAAGLSAGTYSVLVTDSANCSATDSVEVSNTGGPITGISNTTDASCFATNDGTATVAVLGGSLPLTYSWSPTGGNDSTATGLGPGPYTVTVTDSGGCSTTSTTVIGSPPDIVLTITPTMISCAGNSDGSAIVSASGGVGGFTYLWNPTGETTPGIANLSANIYQVQVTDANGCTNSDTVSIVDPAPINLTLSSILATCGANDGAAIVSATGGSGSFSYAWGGIGSTNDTASGVAAGTYPVTVTDGSGCSVNDLVIVNNSGAQTVSISDSAHVACSGGADGTATVGVVGGTSPYSYTWNTSPTQTNPTATGLIAGNYNCTVTDAAACIAIVPVTLTEPDPIVLSPSPNLALCPGEMVTLSVSTSGGTIPYIFTWNNSLGNDSVHTVTINQDSTFTVIVVDANFCPSSQESITYTVGQPVSVTILGGNTATCPGVPSILSATGSGGTGAYTYTWSTTEVGPAISVAPLVTTTYTVTIEDSCGLQNMTSLDVIINPNLVLNPPFDTICPGESSTITATGALFYWWVDELTLDTFNITDEITVWPEESTNYIIFAGDGLCPNVTDTAVVTVRNSLIPAFIANPEIATIFDPTFQFTDLTQGGPTSWNWDFGDTTSSSVQHPNHTYSDTGDYVVTLVVEDENGCKDSMEFTVRVKETYALFVPNTFTPNGDGENDYFFPVGIGVQDQGFEFYVFSRWGDLVFKSEGEFSNAEDAAIILGWDGKANYGNETAQNDVYVWMINTIDPDQAKHQYVGHVTLLK